MIISASRRTDIPTFYSEWFLNRIKEGFLYVRNPMNEHQVSKITLSPEVVDCIVFWTKNPIPMIPRLDELGAYPYYFQFTLTGYGKDVESCLPDKKTALIPAFQTLAQKLGPDRVIWRYDPIAFNQRYTEAYHLQAFEQIAKALRGCTNKCVISFVDSYHKNRKSLESMEFRDGSDSDLRKFVRKLSRIAGENNMTLATCAEKMDLSSAGVEHNACIDKGVVEKTLGCRINAKKDASQRPECQCVASVEVGTYNSCGNGCRYCYANFSPETVKKHMAQYDPDSPILCDHIREGDKITERPMKSIADRQLSLL